MAAKKPFTFTAVSYITDKSGEGKTHGREEIVFEQMPSPKGTCKFRLVKRTVFMPELKQAACDKKMMRHACEILSEYLSKNTEP
jgi:hypothetical protein